MDFSKLLKLSYLVCDLVNIFSMIYLNFKMYALFELHSKGSSIAIEPLEKQDKL